MASGYCVDCGNFKASLSGGWCKKKRTDVSLLGGCNDDFVWEKDFPPLTKDELCGAIE